MGSRQSEPLVIVTRAADQAVHFVQALRARKLQSVSIPCIRIETKGLTPDVERQLESLENYDWIVFTSANAVRSFHELCSLKQYTELPANLRIAVQGAKTRAAVQEVLSREIAFRHEGKSSDSMAQELLQVIEHNQKTLLVSAKGSRFVIRDVLRENGRQLEVIVSHETIETCEDYRELVELPDNRRTLITFFSPSAFRGFQSSVPDRILRNGEIASIGPVTTKAVEAAGFPVALEASKPDSEDFARLIEEYLAE